MCIIEKCRWLICFWTGQNFFKGFYFPYLTSTNESSYDGWSIGLVCIAHLFSLIFPLIFDHQTDVELRSIFGRNLYYRHLSKNKNKSWTIKCHIQYSLLTKSERVFWLLLLLYCCSGCTGWMDELISDSTYLFNLYTTKGKRDEVREKIIRTINHDSWLWSALWIFPLASLFLHSHQHRSLLSVRRSFSQKLPLSILFPRMWLDLESINHNKLGTLFFPVEKVYMPNYTLQ